MEIVKSSWTPDTRVIEIALNGDAENKLGSVFHIMIDEPASASQPTGEYTDHLAHHLWILWGGETMYVISLEMVKENFQ